MTPLNISRKHYFVAATALAAVLATPAFAVELSGTVTSGLQAYPVAGAQVRIDTLGVRTVTVSGGQFIFRNIPAGTYQINIDYIGSDSLVQTITVPEGGLVAVFAINPDIDTVIAVGQRANLLSALNQQRNADNLISVVSSDAIGQFPDQNVTEAVRRVAGISVENDQGEGRFIIIRGVDPNLNSSSINGTRIPSPEGDVRATALDVIDSEVLKSIEITKSLTPDLDGDGIGGNIEIKTFTAFDRKGRYMKAKVAGSYNEQTSQWGPKLSVSASDVFADGNLGVAISGSYRNRKFGSENYEVDGGFVDDLFPEEFELRDYQITRERVNLTGNVDYKLGGHTELYLRTLYSDFTDAEVRSRVEIEGDPDEITGQIGNVITFGEGKVDRDLKDRTESQKIWSATLGGKSEFGAWAVDYSAAISHAEEEELNRLDTDYRVKGGAMSLDVSDPLRPTFNFIDPKYTTSGEFEFDGAENLNGATEDEEIAFALNVRRDVNFGNDPGFIKFGAKFRQREKTRDVEMIVYDGNDAFTLADVLGNVDYEPFSIGPVADPASVRRFFEANKNQLDVKAGDSFIESNLADYSANEDVLAGYLMAGIDIQDLRLVGGVRVETTDYDGRGRDVRLFEEDSVLNFADVQPGADCRDSDGNVVTPVAGALGDDLICISEVSNADEYTEILPSIVARLNATENLILRLSYYKSLARPNFKAIVPSAEIELDDDNEYSGEFGNVTALGIPRLNHQTADSYDFSVEYYTDNGGVISFGAFYKDFSDFIAERTVRDFATSFGVFDKATYYVNLPSANLLGLELNFQQSLSFLDGPLSGVIVGANYTFVDGEATDLDGNIIALPKQSANIANLVLGYEGYGVDVRLAWSYRDKYLDEVGGRFVAAHDQLDFTAKYKINDHFRIFGEISNITDEPFLAFERRNNVDQLSQFESYGRTIEIGLQYKY